MNPSGMQESRPEQLIFAGNGMSALACVEELIASGRAFDITIFGDEPHPNYDRTLLGSVLSGERDAGSIVLNDIDWYQEHGIRTRLGIRVEEIDAAGRSVRSSDGDWTGYDKLILATGSIPEMPALDGLNGPGVFVFATLDDARKLAEAAGPGVRAAVIGGWLAAEAARSLTKRGCEVTLIERAELARFTSIEQIGADLVVIATDLQPNAALAAGAGLEVNRGIVVNDRMETSDPFIFAIGGCTEYNGHIFDLLPAVTEQAKVLARNLLGNLVGNLAGERKHGFTDLDTVFQELAGSPLHHRAE
jgi:nitrite reductase (NADH) large subunit